MSYEGYQEALESQSRKEDELKVMKEQFNAIQPQMLSTLGSTSQEGKQEVAKQLIENGLYKANNLQSDL
jgi:hypothetical protein